MSIHPGLPFLRSCTAIFKIISGRQLCTGQIKDQVISDSVHYLNKVFAFVLFPLERNHFIFCANTLLLGTQIVKFTLHVGLLLKCHML